VVTDTVQLPKVILAWLGAGVAPGDADADVAARTFWAAGKSSRLYRELVYKQQIAQSAQLQQRFEALASHVRVRPDCQARRDTGKAGS
jgi:zinc protease